MHIIMSHYVKVTMSDAKDDAQLATGPLLLLASTGINWHQLFMWIVRGVIESFQYTAMTFICKVS
jgi:hypothetical protein